MPDFTGRVALVTGAAHGQGREHAVQLARHRADVVLVDVPAPVQSVPYPLGTGAELAETRRLVEAEGRRALTVEADVRDPDAMRAAVARTVAELGSLDVVVANAGIVTYHRLVDMDDQAWHDTIDVNLTGVAHTVRAALGPMIEQRWGRIVVTSSQAARRGVPHLAHYAASKWALLGLVRTVALEVASHGGITCNAVLPGAVDTPMMHHDEVYSVFVPDVAAPTLADMESRLRDLTPMPTTWIDPSDVTDAVLYLASPTSRYVSGTAIDVAAAFNAHYG
jgi:SDR family mycofactocin-dependent oxidoreductase